MFIASSCVVHSCSGTPSCRWMFPNVVTDDSNECNTALQIGGSCYFFAFVNTCSSADPISEPPSVLQASYNTTHAETVRQCGKNIGLSYKSLYRYIKIS